MLILISADTVGGVWSYALDLARALPLHQFVVATMGQWPSKAQCAALKDLPNARLEASEWKLEWMESAREDVARAGDWLRELERKYRPDIVHLNGFAHGALPFAAPKIVVGHSCVGSWFRAVKGHEAPAQWDEYRADVRAGLHGANAVVAPTRAIGSELDALYGPLPGARIIHNGADSPGAACAQKQPFVLAAGRVWDEAKNIALLDRIAPNVDWPIEVAGDARLEGAQFRARNVQMLGFLSGQAWRDKRASAAVWAHPARYEPFGLATLEAALDGCALLLADIPTLRELWQDAALFVAPGDDEGWARALNQLVHDATLRADLSVKARARGREYSLAKFGANYAALYAQVSREKPG